MKKVTLQGLNRQERKFVVGLLTTGKAHPYQGSPFTRSNHVQRATRTAYAIIKRMVANGIFTGDGRITPRGVSLTHGFVASASVTQVHR